MGFRSRWPDYIPVAQRRANALWQMERLRKDGKEIHPVKPFKRTKIAKTFWGEGWCRHLEAFSDYENRLPRGRTYVRNGSVCHLGIEKGEIEALVMGTGLYEVSISIKTMPKGKWNYIRKSCTGRIGSLLELLQGHFSDEVMRVVTDRDDGLFPLPGEMTFECSCPDWAVMCKHVAAVLYGVGARLDESPELLFNLRGVDQEELLSGEAIAAATSVGQSGERRRRLKGDVAAVFGVELDESRPAVEATPSATAEASAAETVIPDSSTAQAARRLLDRLSGTLVKRIVEKSGLTTIQFSEALGLSPNTITRWVRRTRGQLNLKNKSRAAFERFLPGAELDEIQRKQIGTNWACIASAIAEVALDEEAKRRTKRKSPTRAKTAKKKKSTTSRQAPRQKKKNESPAKSSKPKPITGKRIAALRKRMGLSAAAFARHVGVTHQTIIHWEKTKGKLRLRAKSEKALSELL